MMNQSANKPLARRLVPVLKRCLSSAVAVATLVPIGSALVILFVVPSATHGAALSVLTGSMTPEIPVGSVVLVRPVDPRTLEVGDVATYQVEPGKEAFITHRIVGIDRSTEPASFTFKGDANKGPDIDPVPAGAIRGEVWFHVPYLGAIRDALHGKAGLSLLAMIVLGGYAITQALGAVKDRRHAKAAADSPDQSEPPVREHISCDGPLVIATFRTAEVTSAPCVLARDWGAVVLTEDDESFSVLLAQRAGDSAEVAELLEAFHPTSIKKVDSSVLLTVSVAVDPNAESMVTVGDEVDGAGSIPTPLREHEHALA